jgi:hypothetical protein
LKPDKVTI